MKEDDEGVEDGTHSSLQQLHDALGGVSLHYIGHQQLRSTCTNMIMASSQLDSYFRVHFRDMS